MSRKLLNRFRCSNPSSGPKVQILPRAKLARFLGRALLAAAEPWARRVPPRGWWPSGRASVSEAGGPGLDSSLARALRCVSARSESFLFNSLYFPRVSKSVLLFEQKLPNFARAKLTLFLGQGLARARARGPAAASVAQWSCGHL